jgi:hypothetical protein
MRVARDRSIEETAIYELTHIQRVEASKRMERQIGHALSLHLPVGRMDLQRHSLRPTAA